MLDSQKKHVDTEAPAAAAQTVTPAQESKPSGTDQSGTTPKANG